IAFEIAREQEQDRLDRPPAPEHGRRLAERRHHPVRLAQREHAADLGGFLAFDGSERADTSLPLQPEHALVETTAEQHGAIETSQIVGGKLGLERGVEVAVAVQDGQVLDRELWFEDGPRHDRAFSIHLTAREAAWCVDDRRDLASRRWLDRRKRV